MLDLVEIDSASRPQMTVIWMHGLGADGHDFEPIVPYLKLPAHYAVRFVFPHAEVRAVTINAGMRMRAWYDIFNPLIGEGIEDIGGIQESAVQIEELIDTERAKGMSSKQIVLAGFSQGGAIALYLGLRHHEQLGGILALSTYLPLLESTKHEAHSANSDTKILFLHGNYDPVIPITVAQRSQRHLNKLGYSVECKNYPIPHSVSPEEIVDIGNWLATRYAIVNSV